MKKLISTFIIFLCILFIYSFSKKEEKTQKVVQNLNCTDCDHIITPTSNRIIEGGELGVQPGDIIGVSGSQGEFNSLTFNEIIGTEENPVIIKNCNGKAIISSNHAFGVKFRNSKHFKFTGDGDENYNYGIKISTESGFFLTFEEFTTNFETYFLEIAGLETIEEGDDDANDPHDIGFAGIAIKTSPYVDCDLFSDETRKAWVLEDVTVRNCYIHDVGGEGMYIGHGYYNGRKESACSETTYSHSIHHISVHDNLIEGVGYDGIQIKNADLDCEVYNNVIKNYGKLYAGVHDIGLFIGDGTTGKFYNNYIINGTGHGIQMHGMGNLDIFNNVVANSGKNGFYGVNGTYIYRIPDGYFNIINNTIINSAEYGFVFYNDEGGTKRLINNIIAGSGGDTYKKGAAIDTISNIITQNLEYLNFTDITNNDYSIQQNSSAINYGTDVSGYNVIDDILGNSRFGNYDVGAYEYKETLSSQVFASIDTEFKMYPNPVANSLYLSDLRYKQTNVLIYTIQGKLIFEKKFETAQVHIPTSSLQEGIYLLDVNGIKYKFIKR